VIAFDDDPALAYVASAEGSMRATGGDRALDDLGWWELLGSLDDPDARTALFAAFRAQGRTLASSAALGGVLALPHLATSGIADGTVAAIRRRSPRRGPVWVLAGDLDGRAVLFDDPDRGVFLAEPDALSLRAIDVPGHTRLHDVTVDLDAVARLRDHDPATHARSLQLGRIAAASEILGAAEQAVDAAVDYAGQREQFGRPIGTFQAVRHILAWATTDCVAVDSLVRKALLLIDDLPGHLDAVVKATAGRNGRQACEHALQVFGGIGFTAEHPHHHHHQRVLQLDALLGSSAELCRELGAWLRSGEGHPGYPAAVLLAGVP